MYAGSALIGVLAAAVAIPVFAFGQGGSGAGVTVEGNAVAVIDPDSNRVDGQVPNVGARPGRDRFRLRLALGRESRRPERLADRPGTSSGHEDDPGRGHADRPRRGARRHLGGRLEPDRPLGERQADRPAVRQRRARDPDRQRRARRPGSVGGAGQSRLGRAVLRAPHPPGPADRHASFSRSIRTPVQPRSPSARTPCGSPTATPTRSPASIRRGC